MLLLPSGVAGRSASWQSAAPFCSAPAAFAIETVPERMALAQKSGAEVVDFMTVDVYDRLQEMTQGRGPNACIDAVETEPETKASCGSVLDRAKVANGSHR
jgi:threonine dehydrogenase-like Zn-dependent dehydrogenase